MHVGILWVKHAFAAFQSRRTGAMAVHYEPLKGTRISISGRGSPKFPTLTGTTNSTGEINFKPPN